MAEITTAELDKMVDDARGLVERNAQHLPEQSAVQGLVRYATATPSAKEVALFARYQAGRFKVNQDFYVGVAQKIEKDYGTSIDKVRRFLGLVAKARKAYGEGGHRG